MARTDTLDGLITAARNLRADGARESTVAEEALVLGLAQMVSRLLKGGDGELDLAALTEAVRKGRGHGK